MLKVEPPKNPDRLSGYFFREWRVLSLVCLFGVAFNGATVLGPLLQGKLIDAILTGATRPALLSLIALYLGAILFIQGTRFFKRFYVRRFANTTCAGMRLVLYNNILARPAPRLEEEEMGSLMTKAVSDVDLCVEGMRKATTEIFDTGVLMVSYLVVMVLADPMVTLLSCACVPVAMLLAERLKTLVYRYSTAYRSRTSRLTGLTYHSVEHALLYRTNGLEGLDSARYGEELTALRKAAVKASVLENAMQPLYNLIALTGIVVVLLMGGGKVLDGSWTVGAFSAYLTYFMAVTTKASKAAKLFNSVQKSQVSWERIRPYLTPHQPAAPPAPAPTEPATLVVEDLTFTYPGRNAPTLSHLSFSAEAGSIIGVTGPIAGGKSTLALALTGLYPYAGSIRICGQELRDCDGAQLAALRSHLGHDPQLLTQTLGENVSLGRPVPVEEALADSAFLPDLAAMPQGLETPVGSGGVRLSGGQQARLSLARALAAHSPLILLDDPFSAVDMGTEGEIIRRLRERYPASIILLVSHRLAIFPQVDQILLLTGEGDAVWGSHNRLMADSPLYRTIYTLQHSDREGGNAPCSQNP